MKIVDIIKQPEGRRLEFKQELPTAADLAKTIVAFANDAGGDLYIGVRNDPSLYIEMTLPEKPKSRQQRYRLTEKGITAIGGKKVIFFPTNHCIKINPAHDTKCRVGELV